jgi:hypothetical protein
LSYFTFAELEADDVICFYKLKTLSLTLTTRIKQIPGSHFNHGTKDLDEVTEQEAFTSLCYQMIGGDSTDCTRF